MEEADSQPKYDAFFTDDKLNIQSSVVDFAHLIERDKYVEHGVAKVYSISAQFGIGKTFFCEKLKLVLEEDSVQTIKMNILERDFYENPLIPILIKMQEVYSKYNKNHVKFPNIKTVLNLCKSVFSGITVEAQAPFIGKVTIDGEKIVNCAEKIKQQKLEQDIFKEYKQYESELTELKNFLKKWAKNLDKPIIIIIDEMDRCRPDYAVKTLEVLKHFFDIPGFVFVLALDEKHLENSVRCLFGTENFDGYKRKFINNTFLLPTPNRIMFTDFLYEKSGMSNIIEQIQNDNRDLVFKIRINASQDMINRESFGIPNQEEVTKKNEFNDWQLSESIIKRYFSAYSNWFKFSLRQMEQIFDRLVLFMREIAISNELFSPDLAVLLVCLHEFDIKVYNKLRNYNGRVKSAIHEFTQQIYKDKRDIYDILGEFDRNLVPVVPRVIGYSVDQIPPSVTIRVLVEDNVDRFFNIEPSPEHPLKWIAEIDEYNTGRNAILNNQRIALITHSKQNAQWKEPEPDITTINNFDLDKFKQAYFSKMDFISHFE